MLVLQVIILEGGACSMFDVSLWLTGAEERKSRSSAQEPPRASVLYHRSSRVP